MGRKYFATVNMKNKTGSGTIYPTYRAGKREFPTGNINQVSIPRVFVKIKATGVKCRFNQSMMCVCVWLCGCACLL